jgi:hypothetical protein
VCASSQLTPSEDYDENQTMLYEKCMHHNLNLHLDTVQHLTFSYSDCKEECYKEEEELREVATNHTFKYFDPASHNPCIQACKRDFYTGYSQLTEYFSKDFGFVIINSIKHIQ